MLKNNQGSTLVMVILIIAVLSILGIAVLNASINDNRYAIKEHDYQQAYYIARAGAEATAVYLSDFSMSTTALAPYISDPNGNFNNKTETRFGGGYFKVSLFNTENKSNQKIIRSEGYYNGLTKTVYYSIIKGSIFNSAIISRNKINIENPSNVDIFGHISIAVSETEYRNYKSMTPEEKEAFILSRVNDKNNNLTISELENVLIDENETPSDTSDDIKYEYYLVVYNFPNVNTPTYSVINPTTLAEALGALLIDEEDENDLHTNTNGDLIEYDEKSYGDLDLGSSNTLTINLDNNGIKDINDNGQIDVNEGEDDSLELYFENLEAGNSIIEVTGAGSLTVFVKTMEFNGNIVCGNSNVKILFKVIDDDNNSNPESPEVIEVNLTTGNSTSELFFYGPYADFSIKANSETLGSIIGDNVTFKAGGGINFDASKGEFSPRIDINMYTYSTLQMKEE